MKSQILILLFLSVYSNLVYTQEYSSMLGDFNEWYVTDTGYHLNTKVFLTKEDTFYEGRNYQILGYK